MLTREDHLNANSPIESRARAKAANPRLASAATVAQLLAFDEVIDVRSPAEFAEDHVPGAINCPVLDDEERARVGTLYKQVSSFEAKKVGAALVSRNIAKHIDNRLVLKPQHWRPLVYCWRGGTRSAALVHVLRQIGWDASQLDGGYKAYRRFVVAELQTLPARFKFFVLCGLTGTGKSRLLEALAQQAAQVLDLEQLAAHRGSVLGHLPDQPQPSQKMFESAIWRRLVDMNPAQPVFVEAESRKIGALRVPEALIPRMRESRCIQLQIGQAARVRLLMDDYRHFIASPQQLFDKLDCLTNLHGREKITGWKSLAAADQWEPLVAELLAHHYDPAYTRSTLQHYPRLSEALHIRSDDLGEERMAELAMRLITTLEAEQITA